MGKTTIARQIQDTIGFSSIYATADSPVPLDSAWIETHWRRAVAEGTSSGKPVLLILDELQKVRGWSETLKMYWDNCSSGPDIRVLILGSSALLVQEGLSESLAGRFFLHRCSHWSFAECHEAFGWNLEQWIYFVTYWREGDYEVDFVIVRGRDIWAIEVKSGRSGKAAGLTRFRDRYPEAQTLLVGAQGIPLEEFFSKNIEGWLI